MLFWLSNNNSKIQLTDKIKHNKIMITQWKIGFFFNCIWICKWTLHLLSLSKQKKTSFIYSFFFIIFLQNTCDAFKHIPEFFLKLWEVTLFQPGFYVCCYGCVICRMHHGYLHNYHLDSLHHCFMWEMSTRALIRRRDCFSLWQRQRSELRRRAEQSVNSENFRKQINQR